MFDSKSPRFRGKNIRIKSKFPREKQEGRFVLALPTDCWQPLYSISLLEKDPLPCLLKYTIPNLRLGETKQPAQGHTEN